MIKKEAVFLLKLMKIIPFLKNIFGRQIFYVPHFLREADAFQVIDFMPRYQEENGTFYTPPDVVRFVILPKGSPKVKVKYDPKLDYAREETYTENHRYYLKSFTKEGKYDSLYLYTSLGSG